MAAAVSMLQVIFAEDLEDADAIARQSTGALVLRKLCAPFTLEDTAARTGLSAGVGPGAGS